MVLLFTSFLVVFIINQRKKLQYHKDMQAMQEERQHLLKEQNELLEQKVVERTTELSEQKDELQKTLRELKATQSQLIHKEKMASLGELTAGVAHEIQNPLNFVINFGEINIELLSEIEEEIEKNSLPKELVNDVRSHMNDLAGNLDKILHYGRRADGIVKSMLQHSRTQTGVIMLTDINELAEEYRRLAYHGFRTKHKSFPCSFQTSYDANAGNINVVQEDIGQVLVNLFNNAFFSMNEKIKLTSNGCEPRLMVSTEKKENKLFITVKDNGVGISSKIIDKIFQPFFTTKPTGEATGLGLSLSYDMIKANQGEIKVNSEVGEFAAFIIELNY
ncbi:MAG TPA: ATP-binding protein [Chitinophagaceae bacterium]